MSLKRTVRERGRHRLKLERKMKRLCSEAGFLDPTDEKARLAPGLLHFNYVGACIHTLLRVKVTPHSVLEGISLTISVWYPGDANSTMALRVE